MIFRCVSNILGDGKKKAYRKMEMGLTFGIASY